MWIAFKICIFDFQKQQSLSICRNTVRCELLSKFVSLTFRNSGSDAEKRTDRVVNCFQNLYLWLSETAWRCWAQLQILLWIAFKICIFDFQKQHEMSLKENKYVVNCFQNLYLWLSETARQRANKKIQRCELLSKFVSLTFRNSFL